MNILQNTLYKALKKNIKLQLDAGAEIVMIFDSWLHDLENKDFKEEYTTLLKDISSTLSKQNWVLF